MKYIKKLLSFDWLVFILISLYTLAVVLVSLHRYWQYDAFYYDLVIFDRAIWQVAHFKAPLVNFVEPFGTKIVFADHFMPSMFLFSPFYWFTQKTEILMIIQSVCVGLSLVFAFLIAKKFTNKKVTIIALLIAFAGYIGLQNALISNFHPEVTAVLPLMICFYAINNKKWKLYWLSFFILLGFKEDMFLVAWGLGLYVLLKHKNVKVFIKSLLIAAIYAFLVIKVIIPHFLGEEFYYSPNLSRPLWHWITDFFYPYTKIRTFLTSLLTFGFLPIFNLPLFLTILATFYSRFVLVGGSARYGLAMHYSGLVTPLMFMAALETIKTLSKKQWFKRIITLYSIVIIAIVFILHRFIFHGPLALALRSEFYQNTPRHKFLNDFVDKVPRDGLIMTQNHLATRFAHTKDGVILLRDLKEEYDVYNPKYIVIELRGGQNPNNFWPLRENAVKTFVDNLKNETEYELIYNQNEQYIFRKKSS